MAATTREEVRAELDAWLDDNWDPDITVQEGRTVVLGLITTKFPELESQDDVIRRINDAARFVDLDDCTLSPQCGFASTFQGNSLTEDEQRAKLEDVVAEHQEGVVALEPLTCRVAQTQGYVEPRRKRNHREAGADRQIDAHDPVDEDDGEALAEHREPAQAYDGLQPQAAFSPAEKIVHLGARRDLARGFARGLTNVHGAHR